MPQPARFANNSVADKTKRAGELVFDVEVVTWEWSLPCSPPEAKSTLTGTRRRHPGGRQSNGQARRRNRGRSQISNFKFQISNPLHFWHKLGSNDFTRAMNGGLYLLLAGLVIGGVLVAILSVGLPSIDELKDYEPRLATRILDRNGEVLTELYTQRRLMTPLGQLPKYLVDAFLVTEDSRFVEHWGVDLVRIAKAAMVDVASMSLRQGASTITQQLARDLYLHKRRTFGRKIRETLTAIQIERHYSKREILEMYLTQIYFGHGAYGVAAAAERYFDKEPQDLTVGESALRRPPSTLAMFRSAAHLPRRALTSAMVERLT